MLRYANNPQSYGNKHDPLTLRHFCWWFVLFLFSFILSLIFILEYKQMHIAYTIIHDRHPQPAFLIISEPNVWVWIIFLKYVRSQITVYVHCTRRLFILNATYVASIEKESEKSSICVLFLGMKCSLFGKRCIVVSRFLVHMPNTIWRH